MNLRTLLAEAEPLSAPPAIEVSGLEYDSRKVQAGGVFFAFPGEQVDGHRFVAAARGAGAVAVVSERSAEDAGVWVQVRHGRRALAQAALTFYDHPDRRLKLIGVTGTNGKTTTVYLIDSILRTAGLTTARLGTIEHRVGDRAVAAVNTTPESLDLVRFLVQLEELGGSHACFESSSHALELGRVYGFALDTAVFTNLSQDHLDFHGDMESYLAAKHKLFEGEGARPPRTGVINVDDPAGRSFLALRGFEAVTYGTAVEATIRASEIEADRDGLRFTMDSPQGSLELRSKLRGRFNVGNILAAAGVGLTQGLELERIQEGIEQCSGAPGRFEIIDEGQPFLVAVDYAHSDDALAKLIESARKILGGRGRVLTVFGCGGDRDRRKRPKMGEAAGRLSDRVIVTSDNPRHEDPLRILADAEVGLQRVDADYERVPDRRQAIEQAISEAREGDIVLLAGKGHETYQQVGSEKRPFDDRETAREVLRALGRGRGRG
jgi:UDP-N-acetylmuramoyl-L-alanyl-D-glutamate--2,6-diaminopimelate ligase